MSVSMRRLTFSIFMAVGIPTMILAVVFLSILVILFPYLILWVGFNLYGILIR